MSKDWEFPEILPPEGNGRIGPRVFQLLGEIIQDKINLGLHTKWLNHYKLGRNQHWKRASTAVPLISGNLLHIHRQRTINTLTDNNPTFNIVELGQQAPDEVYEKLNQASMYWWIEQEQQTVYEESVLNGETYGICIEKVIFNPDLEFNLGEVETIVVDPYRFGMWPVKGRDVQKSDAVFHFYPMSIREAERRWPKFKGQIKPDSQFLEELGEERRDYITGQQTDTMLARIANTVRTLFPGGAEKTTDAEETLIVECWSRDWTRNEDGTFKYAGKIRCTTVCNGGKLVLADRANPSINPNLPFDKAINTYLYDKFPFTLVPSVRDTTTVWGMSDFEQLEQLNREFNKAISQMVFLKDKAARPKILNPKTSGIPNAHFTNVPGVVNPKNSIEAQAIRYLEFPNMPLDVEKAGVLLKEIFFLVSGTFDLEQANTPGREVIAYKAIAALLERAATMMRGKIRNYSRLLRERGRMYISHLQNWYTEDRWFFYEKNGQMRTDSINAEEVQMPIKLTVVNGSMLPVSKIQQREEALVLYEKGAIDQQDLLEKLEWSGRSKVLERMGAGKYGSLMNKMQALGAPPDVVQTLSEVASIEDEDFAKMAEKGELPIIDWPAQQGEQTKAMLETEIIREKLKKERADRQLMEEKITTERVEQRVKEAGIEFDKAKLSIEMKEVELDAEMRDKELVQTAKETNVREKGLKSNNRTEAKK
jgi:hypothetical protein